MKLLILLFISFSYINSIFPEEELPLIGLDIDDLNVDYDKSKCQKVINTLITLVNEIYVYNDISKNPPNAEYYGVINLEEEFKKIETINRKYYDFYRDIKRVIAKMRDLHFYFTAKNCTENGTQIDKLIMCLPISLNNKGDSQENAKMFIEKFDECATFYPKENIKFIEEHLNIPLQSINNKSPFDFIQEFPIEFINLKSKHGIFSLMMEYFNLFPLYLLPLSKEESTNIEFLFEDD